MLPGPVKHTFRLPPSHLDPLTFNFIYAYRHGYTTVPQLSG